MKTASKELQAFLVVPPGSVFQVDLYEISFVGGGEIFLCSGDAPITFNGNQYSGVGQDMFIERSRIKSGVGLQVDDITITITASPDAQPVPTIPFMQELVQGYFDGAKVVVRRLIMPTYGDTHLGAVTQFVGTVGDIPTITRSKAEIQVKSRLEILDQPLPRNLMQPGCRHTLFDQGCLLLKADFTFKGTVQAGSNRSNVVTDLTQLASQAGPTAAPTLTLPDPPPAGVNLIPRTEFAVATYVTALGESLPTPEAHISCTGKQVVEVHSPPAAPNVIGWNCYLGNAPGNEQKQNGEPIAIGVSYTEPIKGPVQGSPPPLSATNGYFTLGVVTFTSGPNIGLSRWIKLYSLVGGKNVITVVPPLLNMPVAGDQFSASAGCDKSLSTCTSKFDNRIHFGGFPFLPQPSFAV